MASINALAAAAASGPSIDKGVTLDSLDGRIVQYAYGIHKITLLLKLTGEVLQKCRDDTRLVPLTNNILLMSGPIFNINDMIYKRFEILNNKGVFNASNPIQSQLSTNSVNFDLNENLTNYDSTAPVELPNRRTSLKTLELFQALCENALSMYKDRLKQLLYERTASRLPGPNGKPIDFNMTNLTDLLQNSELKVCHSFIFEVDTNVGKTEDELNSLLQGIDLSCIKALTSCMDKTLLEVNVSIKAWEKCKTRKNVLDLDHWDYSVHRCLAILLKLADLYAIIRKFGKRIYFQDYHYLKKLAQNYRMINERIQDLEFCFNQQKKSNLVLASIARLTRQGARLQVRPETLLTLAKDCRNGYNTVQEANKSLKDLYTIWTNCSQDFAKKYGANPSVALLRERAKNDVLKQRLQQNQQILEERKLHTRKLEKMYLDPSKNKADLESQAKLMKQIEVQAREKRQQEELDNDSITSSNLSRSSSTSTSSTSSYVTLNRNLSLSLGSRSSPVPRNRRESDSEEAGLSRRHSVIGASPPVKNKTRSPPIVNSSDSSIRSSIASISSMESSESLTSSSPPVVSPVNNKRISSTPLRRSASLQHSPSSNRSNAAAGAGAAFVNRRNLNGHLVERRSNSLQSGSKSIQQRILTSSQTPTIFVSQTPTPVRPMSAQERLQQHILNQSKNGNLNVKTLSERPKTIHRSFGPKMVSPQSSIDSGSRSNSLESNGRSPLNSRTSSLQSITESPLMEKSSSPVKMSQSSEAELLTSFMNRSRSNSVQKEENGQQSPTLNPANRIRSNSASKRPADNIPKIEEDKLPSISKTMSQSSNTPSNSELDDDTLTSINVPQEVPGTPPKSPIKKVRFTGVPKYDASEDAPSPNRALKNLRRVVFRTSSGVEITKSKEKLLTSQEGLAFRLFNQQGNSAWEGFNSSSQKQSQVPSMRNLALQGGSGGGKRISKLFKTR